MGLNSLSIRIFNLLHYGCPQRPKHVASNQTNIKFELKNKNQLDATYYFIVLLIDSTCFGHYYAHHQELATIMLITALVVSFCKDGRGSVNVKLWFLVVCVRCEVVCHSVVFQNVFI